MLWRITHCMWPNAASSAAGFSNKHFSQLFSSNFSFCPLVLAGTGGKYDSYGQIRIFTVLICPKHVVVLCNELDQLDEFPDHLVALYCPYHACTGKHCHTKTKYTNISSLSVSFRVARSQGWLGKMSTYVFYPSALPVLFPFSPCNNPSSPTLRILHLEHQILGIDLAIEYPTNRAQSSCSALKPTVCCKFQSMYLFSPFNAKAT
jgi:hypothetical protein